MKKRVSIYIDEDVWDNFKEDSWKRRKSASALIEEILRGDLPVIPSEKSGAVVVMRDTVEAVIEDVDLELENNKLLEKRKKIADLKESLSWNGGYSKNKQLGKKEAK